MIMEDFFSVISALTIDSNVKRLEEAELLLNDNGDIMLKLFCE